MSARNRILARVRKSLGVEADDTSRSNRAAARIAEHPPTLVPERAQRTNAELLAQFRSFLEGQQATVVDVDQAADVPAAIGRYLEAAGLPPVLRMGNDARLAALAWSQADWLDVRQGAAEPGDRVGLSYATAGISETGTLVVAAGGDNPVTLAFMPETHMIVVARDSIVGSYEQALEIIRAKFGASGMPRTLNYISGPSRTADIGGRIVIGAHGPRRLCVIVTG